MFRPFREHHLICLLSAYEKQSLPLDLFMSHYFKANKAIGSKDRCFIAETAYGMIRWKALLDYLSPLPVDVEKRFEIYKTHVLTELFKRKEIPLETRLSFPKFLFDLIVASHGIEVASELCLTSNSSAPTTLRANGLKISREQLIEKWQSQYAISPCLHARNGLIFHKKMNFFTLPEFKEGLFEVQDEGSQLIADLIQALPGQQVLDYCAGSGGKTLAFAPAMQNRGQIFLHDIRTFTLQECRKRLKRAGIQNAQIAPAEDTKLKKLKRKMDWVLVDAPCSGTGTMRRNPDMKWKFSEETLLRLVGQQRTIFEKALSFMHPEGRIVYATCSLLKEENQEQVEHFLKTYPLELEGEFFQSLPKPGEMDGFFGATFKKK